METPKYNHSMFFSPVKIHPLIAKMLSGHSTLDTGPAASATLLLSDMQKKHDQRAKEEGFLAVPLANNPIAFLIEMTAKSPCVLDTSIPETRVDHIKFLERYISGIEENPGYYSEELCLSLSNLSKLEETAKQIGLDKNHAVSFLLHQQIATINKNSYEDQETSSSPSARL